MNLITNLTIEKIIEGLNTSILTPEVVATELAEQLKNTLNANPHDIITEEGRMSKEANDSLSKYLYLKETEDIAPEVKERIINTYKTILDEYEILMTDIINEAETTKEKPTVKLKKSKLNKTTKIIGGVLSLAGIAYIAYKGYNEYYNSDIELDLSSAMNI